jgi:hypothetical protein
MKSEEITTLAREFSKEHDDSTIAYHAAKDVINFLLRRFCLVEKSKLIEEYKSATANFNNASDPVIPTMDYYLGTMKFIESLFPEIAKEVEG